ncbi:MAG: alpha/beta hydrolase, partial [Lachnospiraceae bacterium]|nr:alpha/beta hydrolase [Lachnospiraceae bacterium]
VFSRYYRVIAVDTRGHGASPRGTAPFTIRQFAEDLYGLVTELQLPPVDLLGFSDGGNIAMLFALNSCARIDKLILNGANLFWDGLKPEVREEIEDTYDDAASELADLEQEEAELNEARGADPEAGSITEEAFEEAYQELLTRRRELCVICDRMKLMIDEPDISPEQLAGITVPTLVIVGTDDMIDDAHSQLIADSLPDARMVRIEGDHFIAMKEPAAFNAAVLDFLLS